MITLYILRGCPYCAKVLKVVDELRVDVVLRDITDEAVAKELLEIGGKEQVPYMIDHDRNVSMYEVDDIVAYLREHYTHK